MLWKASPCPTTPNTYFVSANKCHKLFTKREMDSGVKVSAYLFRELAKSIPYTIGKWRGGEDGVEFTLPDEPSA
eukprot:1545272-Heterocapsa_arctica.AAC.1